MSRKPIRRWARWATAAAVSLLAASVWAQVSSQPATQAAGKQFERAVIAPINDDMINDVTAESIRRRIALARKSNADAIIFEIDTPGGMVSSAIDICNTIRELTDIHTVAWVHPQALSAGAMIAVSCDEIVISRAGRIGDCAPIMVSPTGMEELPATERAKIESPIRQVFRDAAYQNGYDLLLSDAMVRLGMEIYWLENTETGERRFVDADDKAELLGEGESKGLLSELAGVAKKKTPWQLAETFYDPVSKKDLPLQQPVVEADELLTLSSGEAVAFGFAQAIVNTQDELRERYALTTIEVLTFDWAEKLTSWLTSWPVRGLLTVLLLLGAYVEFHTPGVGVAGAVALICLALLLGAPYLTGLATTWEIVAVMIGFALIAVEIFVIPGFGVAGILGLVFVLAGLLGTYMPTEPGPNFWPQLDATWEALRVGVRTLFGALVVAVGGMWALARYLPQIPVANQIILNGESAALRDLGAGDAPVPALTIALGARGTAQTTLRPSGRASIDGRTWDVVAEGQLIERGRGIEVIQVEGNRIVVRELPNAPTETAQA